MQCVNGCHPQEVVQRTRESLVQKRDEAAKYCRIDPGNTATLVQRSGARHQSAR
jgi:hypothetical protein